jgi:glycosyltransferase involved in cell wall biosynthesis
MEKAKIAVVFPVYNGAKTLKASLQCIAEQDFAEFKAFIVENCSTDGTLSISEEFCAQDPRFSIVRNDVHLSAMDNFEKAMRLGAEQGEYFCLRACDDLSSQDFLSSLVAALDANPYKLLGACKTKLISVNGAIRLKEPAKSALDFKQNYLLKKVPRNLNFPAEWIYNLYRSNAAEGLIQRWKELGNPWCAASYAVVELVVRDLVVYVEGPSLDFQEGSGSAERYGAKKFMERLRQRLAYTMGCYKLKKDLPAASLISRLLFFRMCWNDARRKTRYKLFWIF